MEEKEIFEKALKEGVWSTWHDKHGNTLIIKSEMQKLSRDKKSLTAVYPNGDERVHVIEGYGKSWALTSKELW